MGAQIGPRIDEHLFDVPNTHLCVQPDDANGHVFLEEVGFQSIQRLVIADAKGGRVVGLRPGELKPQAQFLYSDQRAEAFVSAARD